MLRMDFVSLFIVPKAGPRVKRGAVQRRRFPRKAGANCLFSEKTLTNVLRML